MEIRKFDLGTILTITSCRLLTQMDDLLELLSYLNGREIRKVDIPKVNPISQKFILTKYPDLKDVGEDEVINSWEDVASFVNNQKNKFGDSLPLTPIPKEILEEAGLVTYENKENKPLL